MRSSSSWQQRDRTEAADRTSLLTPVVAETFVTLRVVTRPLGGGFHFPGHGHLARGKAGSVTTTTWATSARVIAVVTILCLVDDCFASQLIEARPRYDPVLLVH